MISNSEKVEKKVQEAPKPVEKEETIADMANDKKKGIFLEKVWNASRFCVSSLRRGHANLLCIVPILVYVLPKQVQCQQQIQAGWLKLVDLGVL